MLENIFLKIVELWFILSKQNINFIIYNRFIELIYIQLRLKSYKIKYDINFYS